LGVTAPSVEELERDFAENEKITSNEAETGLPRTNNNNFHADQVAVLLEEWAARHGRELQLGAVTGLAPLGDGGVFLVPSRFDAPQVVRASCRNNHYEGLTGNDQGERTRADCRSDAWSEGTDSFNYGECGDEL
jgi:hypothetical protein